MRKAPHPNERMRCFLLLLRRTLFPGVVDDVVGAQFTVQKNLRNGDESVAFLQQMLNNTRQSFGSILRRVVEQDNAAGLHFGSHSLGNVCGRKVFPIQTVTIPYKGKLLGTMRGRIT